MDELRQKLVDEEDFIPLRRFDFSLKKLLERYPDGAPAKVIAQCLLIDEAEVEPLYQEVIAEMRVALGVESGD